VFSKLFTAAGAEDAEAAQRGLTSLRYLCELCACGGEFNFKLTHYPSIIRLD